MARAAAREATVQARYRVLTVYRVLDGAPPPVWQVFILGTNRCGASSLETWAVET